MPWLWKKLIKCIFGQTCENSGKFTTAPPKFGPQIRLCTQAPNILKFNELMSTNHKPTVVKLARFIKIILYVFRLWNQRDWLTLYLVLPILTIVNMFPVILRYGYLYCMRKCYFVIEYLKDIFVILIFCNHIPEGIRLIKIIIIIIIKNYCVS